MQSAKIFRTAAQSFLRFLLVVMVVCGAAAAVSAQHGPGFGVHPPPVPRPIRPIRPVRPIRPLGPYFPFPFFQPFQYQVLRQPYPLYSIGPGLGFRSRWLLPSPCGIFGAWAGGCNWLPVYLPVFIYGDEINQRPELVMKDGTIYTVTDYWVIDSQLHFRALEDGGTRSVEHVVPYDQLDEQKTRELAAQRGFRFVLRNEPMDQYLQDHPPVSVPPSGPASNPQPTAP